jgi:putative ABC transport system permease protein
MTMFARLGSLWRNLVHKSRVEGELDEELRAYVDLLAAEKQRAGASPREARRAALVEVGGVEGVKEAVREVRAGSLVESIAADLRYAVRTLVRTPGFTAAAVVALALGIGANTAILSVVDSVLLRPLPYRDPDRLAVVLHGGDGPVSPANFLDWRRQATTLAAMSAAEYWTPTLAAGDVPEKVWALHTTADLFTTLGVPPLFGRTFLPGEDAGGGERVVVLGYGLWQRRFGGDRGIVGRSLTLDGEPYTVIGVMPRSFRFAPFWATRAEMWAPLPLAGRTDNRRASSLRVFARLAPGASLAQAREEMAAITGRLERSYPGTNRDVAVTPLMEKAVGGVRPALLVLLGGVGFVLLIACANVAHLLLARTAARRKEIALRASLGAGRRRIVRQLLTESLLLALVGGAAGVGLAYVALPALVAAAPAGVPRLDVVAIDGRVLLFTLAATLATGVLFGLAPALQAAAPDSAQALREGTRGSAAGGERHRLRSFLVASEIALALVLLVGAGLMVRSFLALQRVDAGFDPRHVLTLTVPITGAREAEPGRRQIFYQELLARVRALPGVTADGAINHLPLAGDLWGLSFWVEGRPEPSAGERNSAAYRVVLPGYFATMRLPIVRGRAIGTGDDLAAPRVVMVNEVLADRFWPGEDPIGKRIRFDRPGPGEEPEWLTVVGVAKNARQHDWAAPPDAEVYLPYLQNRRYLESTSGPFTYLTLVVRTLGDPAALAPAVRATVGSLDRAVPVAEVQAMERVVADATAEPRFYLLLLGIFAAVAILLAAVGIYGVMSYAVSRRTQEIGVRMALGAGRSNVLRLVVGQSLTVAAAGAAAGLAGAWGLTRLMSGLLFGVQPTDPLAFAGAAAVLVAVALVAAYLPARRAARIDPLRVLRAD